METKVNITPSGNEVVVRTGKAEDIRYPQPIKIEGVLNAPAQFLKGKEVKDNDTHLRIYNQEGKLELYLKDTDKDSMSVITGALQKNADLAEFNINSLTFRFDVANFLRFIKTKSFFFANKEQHKKLISNMQSWNAKIETVLNQANDQKGNSNFQVEQKVRAVEGFVDRFELSIPIFQGDVSLKFTVEIGLDPKNSAVNLYLFSDELFELEIKQREKLMKEALAELDDKKFSKVVVS
jgi:hypothetical protein